MSTVLPSTIILPTHFVNSSSRLYSIVNDDLLSDINHLSQDPWKKLFKLLANGFLYENAIHGMIKHFSFITVHEQQAFLSSHLNDS